MIVFLLLVIIAILLFGAGAMLGVAGWIIGGIAGLLVLSTAMEKVNIGGDALIQGVLLCLGVLFVFSLSQRGRETGGDSRPPSVPLHPPEPPMPDHVRRAIDLDRKLAKEFRAKTGKRPD